jgi:hypothetical protein
MGAAADMRFASDRILAIRRCDTPKQSMSSGVPSAVYHASDGKTASVTAPQKRSATKPLTGRSDQADVDGGGGSKTNLTTKED